MCKPAQHLKSNQRQWHSDSFLMKNESPDSFCNCKDRPLHGVASTTLVVHVLVALVKKPKKMLTLMLLFHAQTSRQLWGNVNREAGRCTWRWAPATRTSTAAVAWCVSTSTFSLGFVRATIFTTVPTFVTNIRIWTGITGIWWWWRRWWWGVPWSLMWSLSSFCHVHKFETHKHDKGK